MIFFFFFSSLNSSIFWRPRGPGPSQRMWLTSSQGSTRSFLPESHRVPLRTEARWNIGSILGLGLRRRGRSAYLLSGCSGVSVASHASWSAAGLKRRDVNFYIKYL
jgi:hypothetical protein